MQHVSASIKRDFVGIANRGMKNRENTISGILKASRQATSTVVEFDVRYNTRRDIIFCHDREDRNMSENETLKALCSVENPMALMVDIKAFGVEASHTNREGKLQDVLNNDSIKQEFIEYLAQKNMLRMFPEVFKKCCDIPSDRVKFLKNNPNEMLYWLIMFKYMKVRELTLLKPVGLSTNPEDSSTSTIAYSHN